MDIYIYIEREIEYPILMNQTKVNINTKIRMCISYAIILGTNVHADETGGWWPCCPWSKGQQKCPWCHGYQGGCRIFCWGAWMGYSYKPYGYTLIYIWKLSNDYWWPKINKQITTMMGGHTLTSFWSISLHPAVFQQTQSLRFESWGCSRKKLGELNGLWINFQMASEIHGFPIFFPIFIGFSPPFWDLLVRREPRRGWLPSLWNLHHPPGCSMAPGMLGSEKSRPNCGGCLEMTLWMMMTYRWIEMIIGYKWWWMMIDDDRWLLLIIDDHRWV